MIKRKMIALIETEKKELLMQRVMQLMRKRTITLTEIEKEELMM